MQIIHISELVTWLQFTGLCPGLFAGEILKYQIRCLSGALSIYGWWYMASFTQDLSYSYHKTGIFLQLNSRWMHSCGHSDFITQWQNDISCWSLIHTFAACLLFLFFVYMVDLVLSRLDQHLLYYIQVWRFMDSVYLLYSLQNSKFYIA